MKFLVLKPNQDIMQGQLDKQFEEFEVKKLNGIEAFITEYVGADSVKRIVGDYCFWISNPNKTIISEASISEVPNTINHISPNLLINEFEFAYGNVVITSNSKVSPDNDFEGLTDLDIGYILNAFTLCDSLLVADASTGKNIAVEKINDNQLSPNGLDVTGSLTVTPDLTYENSIDDTLIM